jgi:biopolymer transport protein ExbD
MSAFALRNTAQGVSAQMNVTPLVDVMLVLLVIFMLAVPLTTQRLPLVNALPCSMNCPPPPEPIRLAIKRTGELYWNGNAIDRASLAVNLGALAQRTPESALEIHVEASTRYALVADVLAAARNAGVRQIGIASVRD